MCLLLREFGCVWLYTLGVIWDLEWKDVCLGVFGCSRKLVFVHDLVITTSFCHALLLCRAMETATTMTTVTQC